MLNVVRVELKHANFDFTNVSIRNIISSVKSELELVSEKRQIILQTDAPQDLPPITGDGKQLHSALTRIVSNAIKYTPDGGQVTITARYLPKNANDSESFIEIVVADTGVGIDLDKQKLIFEKFTTASNVALHSTSSTQFMGGGAGLGLTIAKGVIEAHNGRVWVESSGYDPVALPGSKFYILLPAQS